MAIYETQSVMIAERSQPILPCMPKLAIAVCLLLTGCDGCDYRLCDGALGRNRTYIATISEIYDQNSSARYDPRYALDWGSNFPPPSCQGWDGLVAGAKLSIVTNHQEPEMADCDILVGEVPVLPNGQYWSYDGIWQADGVFRQHRLLTATGETITGECRGRYDILLEHPDLQSNVFAPTDPGQVPNLVIGRTFVPTGSDTGMSCPVCADSFVAFIGK
jgi:hypothetical protein